MRSILAGFAVLLATVGAAHATSTATAITVGGDRCELRRAAVVSATQRAVILKDTRGPGSYLGCVYRRNRLFRLAGGLNTGPGRPLRLVGLRPRLAGRFAAVDQGTQRGGRITSRTVKVVDLATGRTVHSYREGGQAAVTDMELKPNGSVAWILRSDRTGTSVHKYDRTHTVLYRGLLAEASLALSGSSVYWLTPDGPKAARLD